jgi:hypothetical protein
MVSYWSVVPENEDVLAQRKRVDAVDLLRRDAGRRRIEAGIVAVEHGRIGVHVETGRRIRPVPGDRRVDVRRARVIQRQGLSEIRAVDEAVLIPGRVHGPIRTGIEVGGCEIVREPLFSSPVDASLRNRQEVGR